MALLVPGGEQLVVAQGQRPRADQAHLAAQHVDELGQLVDAQGAQPAAERCDAGIVPDLEDRPVGFVAAPRARPAAPGIGLHGPELVAAKAPLAQPDAPGRIEHGAGRGELDRQSDDGHEGRGEDERHGGHHHVGAALEQPGRPAMDRGRRDEQRLAQPRDETHARLAEAHLDVGQLEGELVPAAQLGELDQVANLDLAVDDHELVGSDALDDLVDVLEQPQRRNAGLLLPGACRAPGRRRCR